MTGRLLFVRHAHAGSRWDRNDRERPLSKKGRRQAEHIAAALAHEQPQVVVSSPSKRCVDTVAPLAQVLGLDVIEDERLHEAGPADDLSDVDVGIHLAGRAEAAIRDAFTAAGGAPVVACSHGDVIPSWIELVVARDGAVLDPWQCAKASTWDIAIEDGRVLGGTYRPCELSASR